MGAWSQASGLTAMETAPATFPSTLSLSWALNLVAERVPSKKMPLPLVQV